MDWNERAETAEQRMIDDYDRDRLLALRDRVLHFMAQDVARKFGVKAANDRAHELEQLAASDINDDYLRNLYSLIASVYREGAWQVERTRRTA
jgi:hypothetical protein